METENIKQINAEIPTPVEITPPNLRLSTEPLMVFDRVAVITIPEPLQPVPAPEMPPELLGPIDLDLVLVNFHDEFETNPDLAAEKLHALLIDEVTCEARCQFLDKLSEQLNSIEPCVPDLRYEPQDYLRQLVWLAENPPRLAAQLDSESRQLLAQLVSRSHLLKVAHQTVVYGMDSLKEMLERHESQTWVWLGQQIGNGTLQKHLPDSVGKHVAAWDSRQEYSQIVIGDSPDSVRAKAMEVWSVPEEYIAETFVDPF